MLAGNCQWYYSDYSYKSATWQAQTTNKNVHQLIHKNRKRLDMSKSGNGNRKVGRIQGGGLFGSNVGSDKPAPPSET